MLTEKERSIIQRVKEKQKDETHDNIQNLIAESQVRVILAVKLHLLAEELSKEYGISYKRVTELIVEIASK